MTGTRSELVELMKPWLGVMIIYHRWTVGSLRSCFGVCHEGMTVADVMKPAPRRQLQRRQLIWLGKRLIGCQEAARRSRGSLSYLTDGSMCGAGGVWNDAHSTCITWQ